MGRESKLRVGSLFAGIGGIELGLESTGHYETVWQVEIDDYARKVLEKHWPDIRRHDDICTFPTDDDWECDVICGGFPCQDLSYAGKGAGLDGERSGLFYELARVVSEVGPRYVILENVAALLTRGMGDVLGTMASLGYDCQWHCIPAAYVGAPHIRDRVFIVADSKYARTRNKSKTASRQKRQSTETPESAFIRQIYGPSMPEGIETSSLHSSDDSNSNNVQRKGSIQEQISHQRNLQGEFGRMGERLGRQWATEPDVGRVADGVPRRMDRLRCLGNAVVPQVAQVVGQILWEVHCGQDVKAKG